MTERLSEVRSDAGTLEVPGGRRMVVAANVRLLREGLAVLEEVSDTLYTCTTSFAPGGSAGEHLRHTLDFYEVLLRDLHSARIDYVNRPRNPRIEVERAHALERGATVAREVARISADQLSRPLLVHAEDESAGADVGLTEEAPESWSHSTLHRELQFLISHTVHHFALIAVVLRALGHEPPPAFGVAASTLRHRKAAAH